MIALKKFYGDELLRLALLLSLFKSNPEEILEETQLISGLHISNGSDWSMEHEPRTLIRPRYVHPKSLDNILMNYENQLFEELNSLGRYNHLENNRRIWYNQGSFHTYLVNDVATDTVAPVLSHGSDSASDGASDDNVSSDDNVGQEVKVSNDETEQERNQPDLIVSVSEGFLHNHTDTDIFDEIGSRTFDVNELLNPNEMQIKKESDDDVRVRVKIEKESDDLYSDNANDDFVPYFSAAADKMEVGEGNSVFHQNMADLQDYEEMFDVKGLNDLEYLDVKQQQDNLEQYLLENTPLDAEVYELAPMFDEELVLNVKRERASTSFTSASSSGVSEMDASLDKDVLDVKSEPEERHAGDDLTQEDMDLIEVLWKQDVDMGYSLQDPMQPVGPQATKVGMDKQVDKELKIAEEKIQKEQEETKKIEKVKASLLDTEKEEDLWAGLSYTVDTETGEYVIQGELPGELVNEESSFDLLEEALQLVELGDEAETKDEQPEAVEGSSSTSAEMLHPAMRHVPHHPHHPLAHYHNQSLMRSMSVEQRWQDLASLLTIPPPPDQYQHYHHHQHPHAHPHHNISHGAAGGYAPNYHAPIPTGPEKPHEAYGEMGFVIGDDVETEGRGFGFSSAVPLEGAYKVESAHHPQQHDGIYYQNSTSEMPPNQDGFLQSILNDEDLQLMDMAMNEGMYTMRMLDSASAAHVPHNHSHVPMTTVVERDSASDSAVSSMGSERVPSLSDGEWCDGSDSAQEFHSSKFRPYEAAYGRDRTSHAPQKKHHMFGKRCFQEPPTPTIEAIAPPPRAPGVVKYECEQSYHLDGGHNMHNVDYSRHQLPQPHAPSLQPSLDLNAAHSSHALLTPLDVTAGVGAPLGRYAGERVRHNHTYSAPPPPPVPRHHARDKRVRRLTDGSTSDGGAGPNLSRDEKRAKALGIPMEVHDIINLPMDEFNERLSKHDLSEAQLSLIRDIRRRGKNKVAAQNCRKRKLDQITSLADEVRTVRDRKARIQRDHHNLMAERQRIKERFAALYRHVFQNLRDPEGRPLSSNQYSLQQAADGNVVLVPKMTQHPDHPMNRTSDDEMDRKSKSYDQ